MTLIVEMLEFFPPDISFGFIFFFLNLKWPEHTVVHALVVKKSAKATYY